MGRGPYKAFLQLASEVHSSVKSDAGILKGRSALCRVFSGGRAVFVVAATLIACGGGEKDPSDVAISTKVLGGKIEGQPWSFAVGITNAALSTGDTYWSRGYGQNVPCGVPSDQDFGPSLILDLPRETGSYELGPALGAVFVMPGRKANLQATRGRIEVEHVSKDEIEGGAIVYADDDNSVNGRFLFLVCD
jgi:hypothetical protein